MENFKYLNDVKREEANFILKDYLPLPKNAVTLISASGGTGKTRISLIMADRYTKENKDKKVALWLTEDYAGQVRAIFEDMAECGIVSLSSMDRMIIVLDNPPQLAKRVQGLFKANYEEITKIGEKMIDENVGFAVFDPLLAFYGGDENNNSEARVFIQTFATWSTAAKITTLIIHHSNKDGNSRGATAFHDGVRARYELGFVKNKDGEIDKEKTAQGLRTVTLKKDNWGIRKYLWRLSDGEDTICYRITPKLSNDYKKIEPIETIFEDNNFFAGVAQ